MPFDPSLIARLTEADTAYMSDAWALAFDRLQAVVAADPLWAGTQSAPLMLAHCQVELAPAAALDTLVTLRSTPVGDPREGQLVQRIRVRALALTRAAEHRRAAALLRVLADYDAPIADAIHACTTPAAAPTAGAGLPRIADDPTLSDASVAAQKRRFAGARVLLIVRRLFPDNPLRIYDAVDNFARSAERFGMTARVIDAYHPPAGIEIGAYAGWLQEQILSFKPALIVYDDLFETGISGVHESIGEQIGMVLQGVREILGVRVVKTLFDAWRVMQRGADRPLKGIGTCIDLLQHMHPPLHDVQDATQRAQSYCYLVPYQMTPPTVAPGTIARACFVGSISDFNIGRLVWRAEIGRRDIPLDFLETDHMAPAQRSDQDYANLLRQYQLSVNLTRRANGAQIQTGRTIEVPLCGGVLLEEQSADTAYFLEAGTHYLPFDTVDRLQGLIDELLSDETRRRRLAEQAHRWVTDYFTGDRYWAGLLARLFT